jgi:hypothetical protein
LVVLTILDSMGETRLVDEAASGMVEDFLGLPAFSLPFPRTVEVDEDEEVSLTGARPLGFRPTIASPVILREVGGRLFVGLACRANPVFRGGAVGIPGEYDVMDVGVEDIEKGPGE